MSDVTWNEDRSRFELHVDDHTAFIDVQRDGNTWTLVHTEVPEELGGRGVGTSLVRGALAYMSERGLGLVPRCPFIRSFLQRNPDVAASFGGDTSTS